LRLSLLAKKRAVNLENQDLAHGGRVEEHRRGHFFVVFGEPDIDIKTEDGNLLVKCVRPQHRRHSTPVPLQLDSSILIATRRISSFAMPISWAHKTLQEPNDGIEGGDRRGSVREFEPEISRSVDRPHCDQGDQPLLAMR
jgi:hypothetical protein